MVLVGTPASGRRGGRRGCCILRCSRRGRATLRMEIACRTWRETGVTVL